MFGRQAGNGLGAWFHVLFLRALQKYHVVVAKGGRYIGAGATWRHPHGNNTRLGRYIMVISSFVSARNGKWRVSRESELEQSRPLA